MKFYIKMLALFASFKEETDYMKKYLDDMDSYFGGDGNYDPKFYKKLT